MFKNNRPKYMLIDLENTPLLDITNDEKIDVLALRIWRKYKSIFEELAK